MQRMWLWRKRCLGLSRCLRGLLCRSLRCCQRKLRDGMAKTSYVSWWAGIGKGWILVLQWCGYPMLNCILISCSPRVSRVLSILTNGSMARIFRCLGCARYPSKLVWDGSLGSWRKSFAICVCRLRLDLVALNLNLLQCIQGSGRSHGRLGVLPLLISGCVKGCLWLLLVVAAILIPCHLQIGMFVILMLFLRLLGSSVCL